MNNSNELYHHGILGMKWGVRRFQNNDGSLTSAGKKRYSTDDERQKPANHEDHNRVYDGKRASELSDTELQARLKRMANEEQYNRLAKGKSVTERVLKGVGTAVTVTSAVVTLSTNGSKIMGMTSKIINKIGTRVVS